MATIVLICLDSVASLSSFQTFQSCRSDILSDIVVILYTLSQFLVHFQWVPARVGVQGNEKADKMANEAPNLDNDNLTVKLSREGGKCLIQQPCCNKWQK